MRIIIHGNPIAKKRPRFATRKYGVAVINDQGTEEGRFLLEVMEQLRDIKPYLTPMAISISFFMKRPKSHYGTGKNKGKIKNSAPVYHTSKPDLDNLIKFALDCLNKYLWKDDSQIHSIMAVKVYSEEPKTVIKI